MKLALTAVSLIALSTSAFATDDHIRHVPCTPYNRVEIIGVMDQATVFTFPPGRGIYRVIQGSKTPGADEDANWVGYSPDKVKDQPLGQNLPLWPTRVGRTYMTLITTSDPSGADQQFCALVLNVVPAEAPDKDGKIVSMLDADGMVYNVVFDGKPAPAAAPRLQTAQGPLHATPVNTHLLGKKVDPEQALANAYNTDKCNFEAKGKPSAKALMPTCPLTNGEWTLFRFPGLTRKPAIYINKRLPRQHESGDLVVVEETAPSFEIIMNDDILQIDNKAYDPVGPKHPDGDATVQRTLIQARK